MGRPSGSPLRGIIFIFEPTDRVIFNVLANTIQIIFVSDHVFIIIALPKMFNWDSPG